MSPKPLACILLATLLVLVASCDDSGDGQEPSVSPTPSPAATLTGIHAELAGLLDSAATLTFRVVLERTAPPDIAGDRLVIANTPEATRVDTIPAGSDAPVSSLIELADGSEVLTCQDGPDNWQCFSSEGFERALLRTAAPFIFFPAFELDMYAVEENEARTITGEESRCYLIEPPQEDIIEYCFSPEGVPVYSSPVFGTYEAVELSSTVPDDAFDPPADVG